MTSYGIVFSNRIEEINRHDGRDAKSKCEKRNQTEQILGYLLKFLYHLYLHRVLDVMFLSKKIYIFISGIFLHSVVITVYVRRLSYMYT